MATKISLFLQLFCAIIANAAIRPHDLGGANAIARVPLKSKSTLNDITGDESDSISKALIVSEARKTVDELFTPDKWPTQKFQPIKRIETEEEPTQVVIPSMIPVQPPTRFINEFQWSDFNLPNYPHGADQRVEYYSGTYGSGGSNRFGILMKKSIPGYENILYQEAQIMQALSNNPGFPQLIHYDGRNLIMTELCATWTQYTAVQFQSGGMYLENGYDMMIQMLDALKELHTLGYVHRDISANNIAFGCYYYKDIPESKAPFKLSETSKLYLHEFGATENVFKPILNKYYFFAGNWDFVSNATMHDVEPMFVQDAESLGYVLLYGLNGGLLSWSSTTGTISPGDNIAKKAALNLDENLNRMRGDEQTKTKAKRDIFKYFSLIRAHTLNKPRDLLDYEALKSCFNINEQ